MMRLFGYELFVGIIASLSMLIFGMHGASIMALMALMPLIIRNQKADEREYYLYYKTANYTMAIFFIVLAIISQIQIYTNSGIIEKNWLYLCANAFFIIHGFTGIIMLKTN